MKQERSVLLFLLVLLPILLSISIISAASGSINTEMQKITHYAEEYETGNINYAQFMVYLSSVRENLNEILGATERQEGGLLKQEQIKNALGSPDEETKWVWVENEQREIRLDYSVPVWKKIVFDGKKIQIRLGAFPSIFEKENGSILIYRLNPEVEFKKPEEQLDINGKIGNIKSLAGIFDSNPSRGNGEALAKESVNAEKAFEEYFRRGSGNCEDIMKGIFGAENQRASEKLLVQEIDFYSGDTFEVKLRLEMCDDCEWKWINLDSWLERRGQGGGIEEEEAEMLSPEKFEGMGNDEFESEITMLLDDYKKVAGEGDFKRMQGLKQMFWMLNDAWNKKSNDVWKEVDKKFVSKQQTLQGKELEEYYQNYGWIKEEQEKRRLVKELISRNYNDRKDFYLKLFEGYGKKEYYYEQIQFEKRLVEKFKEFGKEVCNNNADDNSNGQVDCGDSQCGGKFCGETGVEFVAGNETIREKRKMYCILGTCQAKEEEIIRQKASICGNHICEGNETLESCSEDCSLCPKYPPIKCSGNVIFKGKDEKGCPLEPVCINETRSCERNEDCVQPLCGIAECIKGTCQTTDLTACREPECADGDEKIIDCKGGEKLVTAKCIDGLWKNLPIIFVECEAGEEKNITSPEPITNLTEPIKIPEPQPEPIPEPIPPINIPEPIAGNECTLKEDCGGENDVCSNGKCVTLPEVIEEPPQEEIIREETPEEREQTEEAEPEREIVIEEPQEITEPAPAPEPTPEPSPEITPEPAPIIGGVIFNLFKAITGNVIGAIIGLATEEPQVVPAPAPEPTPEPQLEPMPEPEPVPEPPIETNPPEPAPQPTPPQECPNAGEPPKTQRNCWYETNYNERGCVSGYNVRCKEWGDEKESEEKEREQEREEQERRERERRKQECSERCNRECHDRLISPCTNDCVHKSGCLDKGNCDSMINECEEKCKSEKDIGSCVNECNEKCLRGEETWEEPKQEENKEEKGVFTAGGVCRKSQQKTEGFVYFNGWGEPFDRIQPLKQKYYSGGEADWCKWNLENMKKQRKEIEKSLNQGFAAWFFGEYLANTAEDWEQHISGIFEMYWRVVENQRETGRMMECLGIAELPESEYNILNFSYDTQYGSVEYWEEIKTVRIPEIKKEVRIISPYMKIWVFPPKEFIEYEMKKAMRNHEFPGPPEEKAKREREEGPTDEERAMIKQDEGFMNKIRKFTEKYNGNVDVNVQFKDYETGEIVFNLGAKINENEIISIKPMLPEEVAEKDITMIIDFEKIYGLILIQEKEIRGTHIESPPWDKRVQPIQKIKEITNGIKMYFKVRDIINSAEIIPAEAKSDVKKMMQIFFSMMAKGEEGKQKGESEPSKKEIGKNEIPWEDKEAITGEVILKTK